MYYLQIISIIKVSLPDRRIGLDNDIWTTHYTTQRRPRLYSNTVSIEALSIDETQQRPRMYELPFEIIDSILDEAVKTTDSSTLSSLALTSRGFRVYANEARFSTLLPYKGHVGHDCDSTIRRLDTLSDLIRSGKSFTAIPGVAEFIISFQLKVTGYATALQRVLDSKSIPFILANIFRSSQLYTPIHKSRQLIISLHPFEWGYSSDVRSHWTMFGDDLRGEFANLLRFSNITELHLRQIKDLPSSFLQGSKVKKLNFQGVSLHSSVLGQSEPIHLESLAIDRCINFQDLVNLCFNSPSSVPQAFLYLTTASIQINYAEDVNTLNNILSNAPFIERLGVVLHYVGSSMHPFHHISDVHNTDWKSLDDAFTEWETIQHTNSGFLKGITISSSIFTPLAVTIHLLGNSIPQSLEWIEVSTAHIYDRHSRTAEHVLSGHNVSLLADYFAQELFDNLNTLIITFHMDVGARYLADFDAHNFESQCHEILVKQTPLSQREGILQVRIGVNDENYQFD